MFFLLFLGDDTFKVFELDSQCKRVLFKGRDSFSFDVTKMQIAIEEMLSILEHDYNVNKDNIFFRVLENDNELINKVVLEVLGDHVRYKHKLQGVMIDVMDELSKIDNDKLLIKKYGVNYDGKCYKSDNNSFLKKDYSLLAYNISEDVLINALLQSKR